MSSYCSLVNLCFYSIVCTFMCLKLDKTAINHLIAIKFVLEKQSKLTADSTE